MKIKKKTKKHFNPVMIVAQVGHQWHSATSLLATCLEHDEQVTHISSWDNKDSKTHIFDRCKGIKLCTKIGLHKDAHP